jgi:hypothetical protein
LDFSLRLRREWPRATNRAGIARAWNGMAVSNDALASCIKKLRQTLGDDSQREP